MASRSRFSQLTSDVLATMPDAVAAALRGAAVHQRDVPDPADARDGTVPLVRLEVTRGRIAAVEIYRRPLEARALSALDLAELLRIALAREVADALGLDLGEGWDDLDL